MIGSARETNERKEIIGLIGNFALYTCLFNRDQSSIFKKMWSIQKKVPFLIIYEHITLKVDDFMQKYCAVKTHSSLDPKDMRIYRIDYIKKMDFNFTNNIASMYLQISDWMAKINSSYFLDIYSILQ